MFGLNAFEKAVCWNKEKLCLHGGGGNRFLSRQQLFLQLIFGYLHISTPSVSIANCRYIYSHIITFRQGQSNSFKKFWVLTISQTTNSRLFQTERVCRRQFQIWWAPPGWLRGERVGLMTWWLWVRSPVGATFLSGVFSPSTSAEACEKSSPWLWKEKLC